MWIGIDPGKDTGIVVRSGDQLIWHTVVEGEDPQGCEVIPKVTLDAVLNATHEATTRALTAVSIGQDFGIAVEGVVKPNAYHKGKLSFVDPFAVAAPSAVLGAVLAHWDVTVVIPPNKHGSGWLAGYPGDLITPGERRKGIARIAPQNSTSRHARSAWDIAGAGPFALRIQTARAGAR